MADAVSAAAAVEAVHDGAHSTGSPGFGARLFGALQYVLPQHAMSRAVLAATRSRNRAFKDALIRGFLRLYAPDLSEAERTDPYAYESFNAFFTRALRPGVRPSADFADTIVSPVDGTISEIGRIEEDRLLQAKGHHYSLAALLAGREPWVECFRGGHFATIYLAPWNYHRIHMAAPGVLEDAWYVPGKLFSVNAATAQVIPGLFARNERVLLAFRDGATAHAIALIGALHVGCMETVWHGVVTPARARAVRVLSLRRPAPSARAGRGAELGRFNMGSTVILLFPPGAAEWAPALRSGVQVRVGETIGRRLSRLRPASA